jgi:hypothetical protein
MGLSPSQWMKNKGGASFSLQRRLQPAVFARIVPTAKNVATFGLSFNGAVSDNSQTYL